MVHWEDPEGSGGEGGGSGDRDGEHIKNINNKKIWGIKRKSSTVFPSPPLALFVVMISKAHDIWL